MSERIILTKEQVDWKNYLVKSQILDRGWSKSMIKKYLPMFDQECINFHRIENDDINTIKLYSLQRILIIETSDSFKDDKLNYISKLESLKNNKCK
jgi:hypothetical protein